MPISTTESPISARRLFRCVQHEKSGQATNRSGVTGYGRAERAWRQGAFAAMRTLIAPSANPPGEARRQELLERSLAANKADQTASSTIADAGVPNRSLTRARRAKTPSRAIE